MSSSDWISEMTWSGWPRAILARNCRTRAGRWFSGESAEVSKSRTDWYWPWWKALWMLMSSGCWWVSWLCVRSTGDEGGVDILEYGETYHPQLRKDPWLRLID